MEATCVPWIRTTDVELAATPPIPRVVLPLACISREDVAPPPSNPNNTWESTPALKVEAVDVEYLLPLKSTSLERTWRTVAVIFVEDTLEEEALLDTSVGNNPYPVAEIFVPDADVNVNPVTVVVPRVDVPAVRYPEAKMLVDETLARVVCPALAWSVPPIVTFPVVEAEEMLVVVLRVRTPVEETKVRSNDELAPPPRVPNKSWVSTPDERAKADWVDVEYLLPLKSKSELTTVRVPIVEEGVLS